MNRKRVLLAAALLTLLIGDRVTAQTDAPEPVPTLAPAPKGAGKGYGKMTGEGMRGRGMMGRGMSGGMGMCPMIMERADRVEVKNLDDGVTITLRASDPSSVKRIQKMAEAMRLMHEAAAE